MSRRDILEWLVHGVGALVTAIIALPALVTGISPVLHRRREERWSSLGPLDSFAVGQVREGVVDTSRDSWPAAVSKQAVYVWRRSVEEVIVFSRSCTDLGCPVNYDPGSGCFFCPCHGGIFSQDGQRMAGPPDRPLYRFSTRVSDGRLEIDLASVPLVA